MCVIALVNKRPLHSTFGVHSPCRECSTCEGLPRRECSMSRDYFADNVPHIIVCEARKIN